MSFSGARVVTIVAVITLLFGSSRVSVSHAGPSKYLGGVDSDRQQPIHLVANNRAVKVRLGDRSIVVCGSPLYLGTTKVSSPCRL